MKTILSSRRHHYLKRVGIFLIAIALIVVMVGCDGTTTPTRYNLTMAVALGGSGTATDVTNASPYTAGTGVSIKAVAAAGYHFVSWTAPAGGFVNANAAETTFTMPAQDVTVTANFVMVYDLTMAANPGAGGTATDVTNASPYAAGTGVSIKAVAAAGYQFVNWTAPAGTFVNPDAAETTFTMPAQGATVTANFVMVYDLTMAANPGAGGTATDLTNASPYAAGTGVSIKAVAAAGYQFVNWSAPAGTFANADAAQTTFTMPAQHVTVTANFELSFYGGSGTEGDPYQIADWYHLHNVRNYLDSYFILVNDLDSTTAGYTERASLTANGGKGWQPIGSLNASYDPVDPFTGTFDGGYEIRDLFINRPDEDGVGLFGAVDVGGVIEDVGVMDADVTGNRFVGGLVGYNGGDVSYSYATGSVDGSEGSVRVGGLVGLNAGTVSNSYATGATCSVTGRYAWYVGGLVGVNSNTISDCYATGSVTGRDNIGGLVGENDGYVSNSYATGSVDGHADVGGLVGDNYGTVDSSSATGSVTGEYSVGGLVGFNDYGTVSDSHADGDVTGDDDVGGLVGLNDHYGTVDSSYSTGNVTGDWDVGGLVGWNYEGTVSNSFWDTQTSGQDTSEGGTGKTTTAMMDFDTFTDTETEGLDEPWDIIAVVNSGTRNTGYIWNIVDDATYPFLSGQPAPIFDWYDLDAIRDNLGGSYVLMNDLDSTTAGYDERASPTAHAGDGWQPIGSIDLYLEPVDPFTGTFDGQGYEIRDLFIDRSDEDGVGLFGSVDVGGVIENVEMVDADVTGHDSVGGLVGLNYEGTVESSYATGNVTGEYYVGGLVGYNSDTISDCYATGSVTGDWCVGGLVGYNWDGTVSNSHATGSVTGDSMVGGLVGYNGWDVSYSYATGSVDGSEEVGGLVGYNDGYVSNSFWDTQTSGQGTSAGGTGKNTTAMMDFDTFTDTETEGLDEPWDIITVGGPGTRNLLYIWNIVDDETYPFLSWQPV